MGIGKLDSWAKHHVNDRVRSIGNKKFELLKAGLEPVRLELEKELTDYCNRIYTQYIPLLTEINRFFVLSKEDETHFSLANLQPEDRNSFNTFMNNMRIRIKTEFKGGFRCDIAELNKDVLKNVFEAGLALRLLKLKNERICKYINEILNSYSSWDHIGVQIPELKPLIKQYLTQDYVARGKMKSRDDFYLPDISPQDITVFLGDASVEGLFE